MSLIWKCKILNKKVFFYENVWFWYENLTLTWKIKKIMWKSDLDMKILIWIMHVDNILICRCMLNIRFYDFDGELYFCTKICKFDIKLIYFNMKI